MSKLTTILAAAAAPAALAGILLSTAGQASASVTLASAHGQKAIEAVTTIAGRDDSGGSGGTWAKDNFTRDLQVFYLGKSTDPAHAQAPYMFTAQLKDQGTFRDLPGQLTPNQGGKNAGKVLKTGQVSGPMSGYGQWATFYASQKPHNGLAPTHLGKSVANLPAYASSTWPELVFPAGTVFTGPDGQQASAMNELAWGYQYSAVPFTKWIVKTVHGKPVLDPKTHKPVLVKISGYKQNWSDTAFNGAGQLPRDGNILGVQ
jgi:hypothetical protein